MKRVISSLYILTSIVASPLCAGESVEAGMNIAKQLSNAFASAAQKVTPATVFIVSESAAHESHHDPLGMFPEEFLNHFFGGPQPTPRQQRRPQIAQGSGFIVSSDGYIMTNYHVVQNCKKLTVTIDGDKTREFDASFIGGDPQTDTAVIKLNDPPENLFHLEFADSNEVSVGEWVLAVGSPFALEASVTTGIVSAKGRKNLQVSELENFIQTDAAINPGNSGGPMVNLEGKVIGINTAIVSNSNVGIGFAVPSNIARNVMEQIIETGAVTRGCIGIYPQPMDKGLAESFGLKKEEGVIVADVVAGSAGEKAGLRQGDVIIEVDGTRITSPESVRNEVMLNSPGTTVNLKVIRDGKELTMPVVLGSNSDTPDAVNSAAANMGLFVEDISEETIHEYRLNPEEEGVVVVDVRPGSVAARAGIKPGSVIKSIEHQAIYSTQDFERVLNENKEKKRLLLFVKRGKVRGYLSIRRD